MHTITMNMTSASDEQLWQASREGDRDAFGQIVRRYQSLICALAYSATGNLAASQDFAQDTFVAAWRRLDELREPAKLRPWLCGIVRNLTANATRRELRRGGAPDAIDDVSEPASLADGPEAQAVTREEEALLWRALGALPANYREPLVLFYREDQSIAEVAARLDMSEDVVRQRLSRGRAMLRDEMAGVVESALTRSRPRASFTAGVLGALAMGSPSTALTGVVSGGVVAGPAAGLATAWLAAKLVSSTARSEPERVAVFRAFRNAIVFSLAMTALLIAVIFIGRDPARASPWFLVAATCVWTTTLLAGLFSFSARVERHIAKIRAATGTDDAAYVAQLRQRGLKIQTATRRESKVRILGLPLYAYAVGSLDVGSYRSSTARAWIAIGDLAISPLLAMGGVAIAPVAIGGVTVGVISLSVGGIGVGALALGSIAAGWWAFGATAIGWKGAAGAVAVAHDYAVGGTVRAAHANTIAARTWFESQWFVPPTVFFFTHIAWVIALCIVIPLALVARRAWRLHR